MRMKEQRNARGSVCVYRTSTSRRRLFPLFGRLHAYLPHSHCCLISYPGKACEGCKARELGSLLLFMRVALGTCPRTPFLCIFWLMYDVPREVRCRDRDIAPNGACHHLSVAIQ